MLKQYEVKTDGRRDITDYFKLHLGQNTKLVHSPLLVFLEGETCLTVEIIHEPARILALPGDTKVMGIWPGKWRSDYFQFTVEEYRKYLESKGV